MAKNESGTVGCGNAGTSLDKVADDLVHAIWKNNLNVVKQILTKHPKLLNCRWADEGCTPLHHAVYFEHKEMVEYLLNKGADLHNRNNEKGNTPLHDAASTVNIEIVKLLIQRGAKSTKNKEGETPADLVVRNSGNGDTFVAQKKACVAVLDNTPIGLACPKCGKLCNSTSGLTLHRKQCDEGKAQEADDVRRDAPPPTEGTAEHREVREVVPTPQVVQAESGTLECPFCKKKCSSTSGLTLHKKVCKKRI